MKETNANELNSDSFSLQSNCITEKSQITNSYIIKNFIDASTFTDDCVFDDTSSCPSIPDSNSITKNTKITDNETIKRIISENENAFKYDDTPDVEEPESPTTPSKPVDPTDPNSPDESYECRSKPSGTVDDLSTNPQEYKTNSILYGKSLNIDQRINANLHCVSLCSCTFVGISDLSPEGGGALYIYTKGKTPSNSIFNYIENCQFKECQAQQGGAISIYTEQVSRLFNITSCTFESNTAHTFGGAICFKGVYSLVEGCKFINNNANTNGRDIYFRCGESVKGTDKRGFTIQNSKFENNIKTTSSMVYLDWIKSSDFNFNSNEIIINDAEIHFFEFNGSPTDVADGSMIIASNCITSLNNICKSDDLMNDKFKSGFSTECNGTPSKPVDPTDPTGPTTPSKPVDPTDPNPPESEYETGTEDVHTSTPTELIPDNDLKIDESFNFKGDYVEFNKNGFRADNKEFSLSEKSSNIFIIHSVDDLNVIKVNTTADKPIKTSFISPNLPETTAIVLRPKEGSDNYGEGEIGLHANSNLKNVVLEKEKVPLNIYNNEKSDLTFKFDEKLDAKTMSFNKLIVNSGSIKFKIPIGVESIGFNVIEAYKVDKIEINDQLYEINVDQLKLKRGSQLTLPRFNISGVIKSSPQSKLIVESKATFNEEARVELLESSLIDFGSSIVDGICKEVKLLEPELNEEKSIKLNDEKTISLICGSNNNFKCDDWKNKFVGNNEFIAAKCIQSDNQVCLAATNSPETANRNTNSKKPLSSGVIAAIVIVVIIAVAAAILLVIFFVRRKDSQVHDVPSQEVASNFENESFVTNEVMNINQQEDNNNEIGNDPFLNEFDEIEN